MDEPVLLPAPLPPAPPAAPPKSKWPFIVAAVLTLLPGAFALTGNTEAAVAGVLLVAPLGALISGIVLGIRVGRTPGMRFLFAVGFIVACLITAESIAIGGCAISSPKFNFQ